MRRQPRKKSNATNQFIDHTDPILKQFLKEIAKYPVYSYNETANLVKQAQQGDEIARDNVLKSNYRLLVRIAKNFQTNIISINDLIQEGYTGLELAIDKFKPEKKVPFPHFAAWWIKMKIMKYLWANKDLVRLPETQQLGINKLNRIVISFYPKYGRDPTEEELVKLSGLSKSIVANFCEIFNFGDLKPPKNISDIRDDKLLPATNTVEKTVDKSLLKECILKCLDSLSEDQQTFIKDLYGIDTRMKSISELAEEEHVTPQVIRSKRDKILKQIKEQHKDELINYIK